MWRVTEPKKLQSVGKFYRLQAGPQLRRQRIPSGRAASENPTGALQRHLRAP